MSEKLLFTNKVVVITGGGSGLGREYAIEFAKRGAKLVINDLGGSVTGIGNSHNSADSTVNEMKSLGAEAVANYDSVEFGERIIKTAIDTFGRVDIVINNAGILKETPLQRMTEEDWDLMLKVHLKGSFSVSKAAWSYMINQNFGRIINTSSAAGLYGINGQANYAAAKLAVHGLTQSLSKEGKAHNICINTIVPMAASRLTQDNFSPELLELLIPEKITPLIMYLSHPVCQETGGLFEVAGGWVTKLRWQRSSGVFYEGIASAEQLRRNWRKLMNFDEKSDNPISLEDTLEKIRKFNKKPKI